MVRKVVRQAEREVQYLSYHSTQKSVRLKENEKEKQKNGKRKNGNKNRINYNYRGISGKH